MIDDDMMIDDDSSSFYVSTTPHSRLLLYSLYSTAITRYPGSRQLPIRTFSTLMSSPRFSKPLWHLVDARNQVVGRLATQIVHILKGKHKPTFTPNYDCGDYVVVVNAKDIKLTGKKVENKLYSWHTGYPGGIKHINAKTQLEQKPEEVLT